MPVVNSGKTNIIGNIASSMRTQTNSIVSTMIGNNTGVNNIRELNLMNMETAISTRRNTDFNRQK